MWKHQDPTPTAVWGETFQLNSKLKTQNSYIWCDVIDQYTCTIRKGWCQKWPQLSLIKYCHWYRATSFKRQTCQSKERADIAKLKAITKRLDCPTNGRKDHNQVANSVPCSKRQAGGVQWDSLSGILLQTFDHCADSSCSQTCTSQPNMNTTSVQCSKIIEWMNIFLFNYITVVFRLEMTELWWMCDIGINRLNYIQITLVHHFLIVIEQ